MIRGGAVLRSDSASDLDLIQLTRELSDQVVELKKSHAVEIEELKKKLKAHDDNFGELEAKLIQISQDAIGVETVAEVAEEVFQNHHVNETIQDLILADHLSHQPPADLVQEAASHHAGPVNETLPPEAYLKVQTSLKPGSWCVYSSIWKSFDPFHPYMGNVLNYGKTKDSWGWFYQRNGCHRCPNRVTKTVSSLQSYSKEIDFWHKCS